MQDRLYLVTGSSEIESEIHYLPLPKFLLSNQDAEEDDFEPPSISWTTLPFPTNPLIPGPRPRKGAGLLPITTGNGRSYLLYFLGEKASLEAPSSEPETPPRTFWSDAFSYQAPSSSHSAAGSKDATRATLGFETGEDTWAEIKVVANEEGAGLAEIGGKSHPGPRGWFGSDALDGGKVVLWGGIDAKGETEGDGWIVSVKWGDELKRGRDGSCFLAWLRIEDDGGIFLLKIVPLDIYTWGREDLGEWASAMAHVRFRN